MKEWGIGRGTLWTDPNSAVPVGRYWQKCLICGIKVEWHAGNIVLHLRTEHDLEFSDDDREILISHQRVLR
jgi:hypothetical protein